MATYDGLTRTPTDMVVGARITRVSQGYSLSTKEIEKVSASKPRVFPSEWKATVPSA